MRKQTIEVVIGGAIILIGLGTILVLNGVSQL